MADVTERLALIAPLAKGAHEDHEAMCVMEAVAFVAGEPWSDYPECACPVISAFLRAWNDALSDDERDPLLRPLIPRMIGTRRDTAVEQRRATMAIDWLVRVHTPVWLRLAKLDKQADALASLPEITDITQCPSLMPALKAARDDAAAVWGVGWVAGRTAAMDAARAAAMDAAMDATRATVMDPGRAAAMDAAMDAAMRLSWTAAGGLGRAAAMNGAWVAAMDAATDVLKVARDAATDVLKAAKLELQQSALALVERMIEER
jgi:hypothetical protein